MTLSILSGWSLLAQEAATAHGVTITAGADRAQVAILPVLLAVMVPAAVVILVAILYGIRHARFERELEHAERMKALETGQTLPQDAPYLTPNKLCLALGAVMPAALFVLALAASKADPDFMPFVWPVAGALGGIGIICGTLLALILPRQATPAERRGPGAKLASEPDAYDVASSRAWGQADGSSPN